MQDFKLAAAGEREETSQQSESSNKGTVTQDYLLGTIHFLEAFTGKTLGEQDARFWMERLAKYPKWKLEKLIDYTGGLNNEVFKFLDAQRPPEVSHRALPGPDPTSQSKQIAKDFTALVKGVMEFQGSREHRLKWEWSEAVRLDKKWLHLDVMKHYRNENRFEGIV